VDISKIVIIHNHLKKICSCLWKKIQFNLRRCCKLLRRPNFLREWTCVLVILLKMYVKSCLLKPKNIEKRQEENGRQKHQLFERPSGPSVWPVLNLLLRLLTACGLCILLCSTSAWQSVVNNNEFMKKNTITKILSFNVLRFHVLLFQTKLPGMLLRLFSSACNRPVCVL